MSRFYEAMKRALEQQAEPRKDERASAVVQEQQHSVALPFDPDATTPVRRDPLHELEEFAQPGAAAASPAVAPVAEAVPLRLAEPPSRARRHPLHPAYERIIQRLLAFRGGRRQCTLLIASAVPGEGASTVARNLAIALGESHPGSVVLVDANLRAPTQHLQFPTGTADGLAEVLRESVRLEQAVREVEDVGIAVLPSGRADDSIPHLLTIAALQGVMARLQSSFDWVILDGPPVTSYPDAANLAVVADGAILVLRAERTRWEVAEKAIKALHESGAAVLGGVLNGRKYHIPDFIYKRL